MVRSTPMIAVLFAFPALSIAGIPPFSGFVAKFALVDAGVASGEWFIVVVSLGVSLLTMYVMARIWSGVFWGEAEDAEVARRLESSGHPLPLVMTAATTAVVALTLALMVFAGPLYDLAERAAADLLAPQSYIDAVLGSGGDR
jgi:multicomponent Na+:H+ antiporter subunit D